MTQCQSRCFTFHPWTLARSLSSVANCLLDDFVYDVKFWIIAYVTCQKSKTYDAVVQLHWIQWSISCNNLSHKVWIQCHQFKSTWPEPTFFMALKINGSSRWAWWRGLFLMMILLETCCVTDTQHVINIAQRLAPYWNRKFKSQLDVRFWLNCKTYFV